MCVFLTVSRNSLKNTHMTPLKCPEECESISISTYITSGNSDHKNKLFSLASNLVESKVGD